MSTSSSSNKLGFGNRLFVPVLLFLLLLLYPVTTWSFTIPPTPAHIRTFYTGLKRAGQKRSKLSSPTKSLHRPPKPTCGSSTAIQIGAFPLIDASDSWGNWAVLSGTATLAQILGKSTSIGRLLGPPVTAMALTFCLASIGVLNPGGTTSAKALQLLSLQLATPLLLLGADLRDCAKRCGPLLGAFIWAALATILACLVGWKACGGLLSNALGSDGLVVAAALMAKNVGGGLNYVAVCRSLGCSAEAFAAGLCVDNIFGLIYFPISSALAAGRPDLQMTDTQPIEQTNPENTPITIKQLSTVLWLAALMTWFGEKFGGTAGALPLCTLSTVLLATFAPLSWMQPLQPAAHLLGTTSLYLFFATAGAPGLAVADSVKAAMIPLGLFLSILYSIHGTVLAVLHKLGGGKGAYEPQRLLVASSAAIGGPATAAALAQASGWKSLLVPSLLVGNLGYAIATFAGLAYHAFFSK